MNGALAVVNEELKRLAAAVSEAGTSLNLSNNQINDAGAAALSEALKSNATLTTLFLGHNEIGDAGAAALSEALKVNATLTSLDLWFNQIGDAGAAALSEALKINATLTSLNLYENQIGDAGAAELSEALRINATLTSLDLSYNQIDDAGAAALLEALKSNETLTELNLESNNLIEEDLYNLVEAQEATYHPVADRLRINKLVLKIASWVASAMLRRVELWDDNLVIPPAIAARAAVLAFGDELIDLELPCEDLPGEWLSRGGRDSAAAQLAAAQLLPRAAIQKVISEAVVWV